MRKIPEIAHDEALKFKEQALALISQDYERIIESGFLDKDDFYNKGEKINDFNDEASKKLKTKLSKSSSKILTAYQVDRENNEIDGSHSLYDSYNLEKAYITLSVFNGKYINGKITFSNTGEAHIMTFDKNNKIIDIEETEINYQHEFLDFADHISDEKFLHYTHNLYDLDTDELIYYFNTIESDRFESEEEYYMTANNYISIALCNNENNSLEKIADNIIFGEGKPNYILIKCEYADFVNDFIVERDGNVRILDNENEVYKQYKQGREFTFKGEKFIAEPGVLETVEMQLHGLFDMESSHREIYIEDEEPEVKRKNKFKP